MTDKKRGADILVRALETAGLTNIFTLSGNHIMPVFDAALGSRLRLFHVRHEAAAVHMADAWARLTGQCGIALVTGGPGHANAVGALFTALAAEAPMVLLSGHAPLKEQGRGSFQEMRQADLADPVAKGSWVAGSAATLGRDVARAVALACSGRPGPVHLSLPSDVLEEAIANDAVLPVARQDFAPSSVGLTVDQAGRVLAAIAGAERPLVLAGPAFCHAGNRDLARNLADAIGAPVIPMESPRGVNDPSLGAFAEVLARADLVVLLGKPHDFTLRFADAPVVDATARFVVVDPDHALVDRAAREKGGRLIFAAVADPLPAARALLERATPGTSRAAGWGREVAASLGFEPPAWAAAKGSHQGFLHPLEMCAGIRAAIEKNPAAVLICDGGEIGQWAQAAIPARRRIINGVSGSIGSALPFALAARAAEPAAPVIAVMGDGTFGFHMAEIDTAVRCDLPFVAVIGNDAAWNAEYQIQLRSYGKQRAHGCELLPTRYDQVAAALGAHGELVTSRADLEPAIARAIASGKPAVVNVMIERVAAPVIRRS